MPLVLTETWCLLKFVRKSERSRPRGDRGIDERIILRRILRKQDVKVWAGFIWLKTTSVGFCKHGNESSGSLKDGEFIA
jgi:hypothetical protein